MTEKEYLSKVAELNSILTKENAQDIKRKLDEMYEIKPTRLPWFVTKAKAMLCVGENNKSILGFLANKAWNIYDYDGIQENANLYSEMSETCCDFVDAKRNRINPWISIESLGDEHKQELIAVFEELQNRQNAFLEDISSDEKLLKLQESYFVTSDYVSYSLVSYFLEKRNVGFTVRDFVDNIGNFPYLKERIFSEGNETFIIVVSDHNLKDCEVAATIISMMGKNVYLIIEPLECPVDYAVDMTDTVAVSISNMQECEGVQVITPLDIVLNGKVIGNNVAEIINYLAREYTEKGLATILASGTQMDDLCELPLLQKQMERLYNFMTDGLERTLSFGWVGNYMTYISNIYGFDTEEAINQSAECDFSIVIPARNSAYSLRYTLKTCLEVEYAGSYEIVISDNSTNGNQEVYNLICELNDDRIKYYKTPRDLHLPKSFEYAFLKAKGEFILSLGSDDGILPGSLDILKEVLEKYQDEQIVMWDRGFYAWPGFNGGQQNQFVVPKKYEIGKWNIKKTESKQLLASVLVHPDTMYDLPMLYINSGFRRSYYHNLLEKTGRLWDGICQDIYMGVVNIAINEEILKLEYPLTIAGMTNSSVGRTSNAAVSKVAEANETVGGIIKSNLVGGFSTSRTERLMPQVKSDISSLYNSLLRAVARGIMPRFYLEHLFDWKMMYLECSKIMNKSDVFYDKNIHYLRYTATKHGKEFLKWFDEVVYPILMKPEIFHEDAVEDKPERTYDVGYDEYGKLTLDASEYGVENIHDAVRLFLRKMPCI